MRSVAVLFITAFLLPAADPLPIPWEMTTTTLMGKKAILILDTGARIEGNWISVTPDSYTIEIEKSRGPNRPPKGIQTLPRASIASLRLRERRIRGRAWGTAIGFYLAVPLAWQVSTAAAAAPVFVGTIALGFFAGRALDKTMREVHIEP
jgi:hypothetical protein